MVRGTKHAFCLLLRINGNTKKTSSFYINAHLLDLSRLDIPSLTEIMHFQNERSEKVAHNNKHMLL